MTKDAFAAKWADKLIDVEHPDLGPKSNLFCSAGGDRMFLVGDRLTQLGFGSVNNFNHGGVCGMTGVMANVRTHPTTNHKRMYADIDHCECLIIWGTEPMTANKGPSWLAPRLSVARERGMKLYVVDPRQGRSASKADVWLPVIPGKDAELAFAMMSWIIANERYDAAYLSAPSKKAAAALGEPTWSDATHLVAVDLPNRPIVTAKALGRAGEVGANGEALADDARFVLVDGELTLADAAEGAADLLVDAEIDIKGKPARVKSVFQLLKERVEERTLEEYAADAGIEPSVVEEVAREFTSHGKRACVMSYRGPAMHANGFDAVRAVGYLNFLIGNHDWKGGHIAAAAKFAPFEGRYDLKTVPDAHAGWGIPITRQKTEYEKTSYFKQDGYPAPRPWYPLPGNLSHEIVPTLRAGYVYDHLGALFIHRHSLVDSTPGGRRLADVLGDQDKINLLVSFDVEIGDTSRFADFVLPDKVYLERFSQESIYPNQAVPAHPAGAAGGARLRRPALGGGRVLRHHATPRAAGRRRACRAGGQGRRRRHGGPFDRVRLLVEDGREHRLRRREAGAGRRRRRARPVRARPQARAGRGVRSGGVESRRHRRGMAEGGVRAEPRRAVRVGRPCEGRRLRRRSDQDEVRWLVRVLRPEDGFAERRVDR